MSHLPPKLPDAGPIDGSESLIVSQGGKARRMTLGMALAPHETRLRAVEAALGAQAIRDAAQDTALAVEAKARGDTDTATASRIAAIEARPEEVAHFTATKALPNIAIGASVTLSLTSLVPAKTGDVLKAGETVDVQPAAALPAGLNIAAAMVPADGRVDLQLTAGLAITAGAALAWNITALR